MEHIHHHRAFNDFNGLIFFKQVITPLQSVLCKVEWRGLCSFVSQVLGGIRWWPIANLFRMRSLHNLAILNIDSIFILYLRSTKCIQVCWIGIGLWQSTERMTINMTEHLSPNIQSEYQNMSMDQCTIVRSIQRAGRIHYLSIMWREDGYRAEWEKL